jgi:antitoxin HicB
VNITKLPYRRVIIPDAESGTYTGMIEEFPGCIVQGDSPAEVYRELNQVANSWIAAAKAMGQEIPKPKAMEVK